MVTVCAVGQVQVDLEDWVELTMVMVVPPLLQWVGVDEEGKVVISLYLLLLLLILL